MLSRALATITADRRRMRFCLGLIIEADEEPRLKAMVGAHMDAFDAAVAA